MDKKSSVQKEVIAQKNKKRQCPFPPIQNEQGKKIKPIINKNEIESENEQISDQIKNDEDYKDEEDDQQLNSNEDDSEQSSDFQNESNSQDEEEFIIKKNQKKNTKQTQKKHAKLSNTKSRKQNCQNDQDQKQTVQQLSNDDDDQNMMDQEISQNKKATNKKSQTQNEQKVIRPKQFTPKSIPELIEHVQKYTKHQFSAVVDDNNKIIENVQNCGGQPGTMIEMYRNGEYKGLGLMLLEETKPLLTNLRIIKALQFIESENLQQAMKTLCIEKEVLQTNSLDLVYQVINTWLLNQQFGLPPELQGKQNAVDLEDEQFAKLKQYIFLERHSAIKSAVKVTSVGLSKKGHSVVPESWLDRDFPNCNELHNEMNKLDWRLGKPPITFCATYGSFNIIKPEVWGPKPNGPDIFQKFKNVKVAIYLFVESDDLNKNQKRIGSEVIEVSKQEKLAEFLNKLPQDIQIICCQNKKNPEQGSILFAMKKENFFESDPTYQALQHESVGILVSRLQKAVRRGRKGPKSLLESITALSKAPPYNLPDQKFVRVSASRQIMWRSFIICVEDSLIFLENDLGMQEIVIFSILTQIDPNLQFNKFVIDKISCIMLEAQFQDTANVCMPWRTIKDKFNFNNDQLKLVDILSSDQIENKQIIQNEGKIIQKQINQLTNAFKLALRYQIMMQGDQEMLSKSLTLINKTIKGVSEDHLLQQMNTINIKQIKLQSDIKKYLCNSDLEFEKQIIEASFDMHCMPNIILELQSSLPFLPTKQFTTKELSKFIWDYSSSYNIRYSVQKNPQEYQFKEALKTLKEIQQNYYLQRQKNFENKILEEQDENKQSNDKSGNDDKYNEFSENFNDIFKNMQQVTYQQNDEQIDKLISKIAFLKVFGKKMRIPQLKQKDKSLEVIICGTEQQPIKVKTLTANNQMQYLEGQERFDIEVRFVQTFMKTEIESPDPPAGYNWVWNDKKKICINMKLVNSDTINLVNKIQFIVEGIVIDAFDASKILQVQKIKNLQNVDPHFTSLIKQTLYYQDQQQNTVSNYNLIQQLRALHYLRVKKNDQRIFDVYEVINQCKQINSVIWKHILVKFFTDDDITIGPVDRSGEKLQNSISYQYEGTIFRIFNLLSALYPFVLKISGNFKFKVIRKSTDYLILVKLIKTLASDKNIQNENKNMFFQQANQAEKICSIKTNLWEHQIYTVDKITDGFINYNKLGFGDASCVGAGKTLTALSVINNLYHHNQKQKIMTHKGFLILIPVKQLFDTWQTEIKKHTKGFELILQNADGSFTPQIQLYQIKQNTIILTTLARIRDHPFYISWQLVVIDECLAVQHREALQTQEAWRQVVCSQFGVLMMSATFFRSRFDQLFYMLKMLQSGLPEQKEYLDSILNESMVCYINENARKWITSVNKFELSKDLRQKYEKIKNESIASEKLYSLLADFLYNQYSIINDIKDLLKKLETENCRVLIYSRSKEEADQISQQVSNVTRYPDKSGKHVVLSYREGTFGLNDLIIYNTILSRPPEPDKLPQMKGRLDRPGQLQDVLRLEYMLVGDTIEEAWLIRLEIAKKFLNDYILPLSKFFDIAVGRNKDFEKI